MILIVHVLISIIQVCCNYDTLRQKGKSISAGFRRARVRALRKAAGYSQEDFALEIGLDRTYMGGVERGERNLALLNIAKIARGLQISESELFAGMK